MGMLQLLALPIAIGSLVCDILIIIRIFKADQIGLGILAIFCPLFTFIYGWIKSKEWNIQQIMLIWSVLIAINILINVVVVASVSHAQ